MKAEIPSKRIYLVNRDFQFRYTRIGVLAGVASTIMTTVVILYPLFAFKILVVPQFLPSPILLGMLVAAFINIGMIVLFGILITHRIAGPMFSMVRHLRRIAAGQWRTTMRIRPGDELHILVRNLNELSDALIDTASKDLQLIDNVIESVPQASPQTTELLQKLRKRIQSRIDSAQPSHEGQPND